MGGGGKGCFPDRRRSQGIPSEMTEVKVDAVTEAGYSLIDNHKMEISSVSRAKSNQCIMERGVGSPPVRSAQHIPRSTAHALCAEYVETAGLDTLLKASPSNLLGVVRHDRSLEESRDFGSCPVVCLDLPQFTGPPLAEVWTSSLSVNYHQVEGIRCAMNDEVLLARAF